MKRVILFALLSILLISCSAPKKKRFVLNLKKTSKTKVQKVLELAIGDKNEDVAIIRTNKDFVPFGMYNGPTSFFVKDNFIYIVDSLKSRVVKFDINTKKFVSHFSYLVNEKQPNLVNDILVDNSNNIILSDSKNRLIVKFNEKGEFLDGFGKFGREKGEFFQINLLNFDKSENIIVYDGATKRSQKFDKSGKLLVQFPHNSECVTDSENNFYYLRKVDDTNIVLYKKNSINMNVPFIHIKTYTKLMSTQLLRIDKDDNFYIKAFLDDNSIKVMKISKDSKLLKTYDIHNNPNFESSRYQVVSYDGRVFAYKYENQKYIIEEFK